MSIIWMLDRICGRPKKKERRTGQSSLNEPAGKRYTIVFLRLSKHSRPRRSASTKEEKDSSSTKSAASMATSLVPGPLMAIPQSALFKAGESFTPSPTMATMASLLWNSCTILNS